MATCEWKSLILNRIIALRRFAEPFQNLSNHFKNARADRSMTIAGFTALGTRVFFAGARSPYGAMAQRTVVLRSRCFPVPVSVDDATAAALPNPGVSAWLSLTWRGKLAPNETVLILGATGVTGRLAVQIAKLLGAGRVVAAGRNETVLSTLHELGADTTIRLGVPDSDLVEAFAREAGETGYDVIIDYLWGRA